MVLNTPIQINGIFPVHVEVKKLEEPKIILESRDLGFYKEFSHNMDLLSCSDPEDPFSLAKASLIVTGIISENVSLHDKLQQFGGGLYLNTEVLNVPKGSGLGTSSILGAACIQAVLELFGSTYTKQQLIQWVLAMEQLMTTGGGWQDQAGGISDGINLISSRPGDKQELCFQKVPITKGTKEELEKRLLLVFTGQKRLARGLLQTIMGRYINREKEAIQILTEFKIIAKKMEKALMDDNIEAFSHEMDLHWSLLKKLDPECTNKKIEKILDSLSQLICGRMICGAGGGGYLQVLLKPGINIKDVEEQLHNAFPEEKIEICQIQLCEMAR